MLQNINNIKFVYAHWASPENVVLEHSHGGCELIYLDEKSCKVDTPLGTLYAKPGDLLVIPPVNPHNQVNFGCVKNMFCVFQAPIEIFDQSWRLIHCAHLPWVRLWMMELADMTDRNDTVGADAVLLGFLQRLTAHERGNTPLEAMHPRLQCALDFIQKNFTSNISVKKIATIAGISNSLLWKLFHTYCGKSPMQYLLNLRLTNAERLLHSTRLSIAEIAFQSGFESTSYFIRLYRQKYGIPPGQKRRKLQGM